MSSHRLLPGLLVSLLLCSAAALPALAEQCSKCKQMVHTKDIGSCKLCGEMTTSGQFQLCMGCSDRLHECECCRKPLAQKVVPSKPEARTIVMVKVMAADRGKPPVEEWIQKELKALGSSEKVGVTRDWFPLGAEIVQLHDSKHFGQAALALKESGPGQPLLVQISGSHPTTVELKHQVGERCVIKHTLASSIASMDLYLAFQVEAPKP